MKNSKIYPYVFSVVVVIISGFILLYTQQKLYLKIRLNEQTHEYKILFKLINFDVSKLSSVDIAVKFQKFFKKDQKGDKFRYSVFNHNKLQGYLYPFRGQGFWSPIEGYLFVDPKLYKIKGIAITHQEETPGLGAEIEKTSFLTKFKNKKITYNPNSDKIILKLVSYGKSNTENEIDGISGATETTKRFALILKNSFLKILQDRKNKK